MRLQLASMDKNAEKFLYVFESIATSLCFIHAWLFQVATEPVT